MTKSPIKPGCRLKRFEEPVTMLGSYQHPEGYTVLKYRGFSHGRPYETEDRLSVFTHAHDCPCRRPAGSKLVLKPA